MTFQIQEKDKIFHKSFVQTSQNSKPLFKTDRNNLIVGEKYSNLMLSGRLWIISATILNCGQVVKLVVDKSKSDHNLISLLLKVDDFLKDTIKTKDLLYNSFINSTTDDTLTLTISDVVSNTVSLKKPYKIQISDMSDFKNFSCMITMNSYISKTYVNYMSGLKLLSLTILYNKVIYEKYNIPNETQTAKSNTYSNYTTRKNDIIDDIIKSINDKKK